VICLIRLALVLWQLGYPEQAQQKREEALALARQLAHPFTLAYALAFAIWLTNDLRDEATLTTLIETALTHCRKYDIRYWLTMVLGFQGRLWAEQGQVEAALDQLRIGSAAYLAIQADVARPQYLISLAQAYIQAGDTDQALSALDEGLATVANYGDYCYEPELHYLKGELLQTLGTVTSAAEASLQQAYTFARQRQAKSLELRAAVSLSRLWLKLGKREQARRLLTESYAWFTEGFESTDLQAARALLAELN